MESDPGFGPEQDADIAEREEDDSLNEVVMAVDLRDRGTIGCAYYIAREQKLYMAQDVRSGGIEIIETRKHLSDLSQRMADPGEVKLYVQPTVILLSTKSDESVSTCLDPTVSNSDSAAGDG